jgi:signal transduction histidine kinase
MDNLQKLHAGVRNRLILLVVIDNAAMIGAWWLFDQQLNLEWRLALAGSIGVALLMTILAVGAATSLTMAPITALWQTIVHLSPNEKRVAAPRLDKLHVGRELITNLSAQIAQLASVGAQNAGPAAGGGTPASVIRQLPLPVVSLNKGSDIIFANEAAAAYVGKPLDELVGNNFYSVFNLSFSGENTLDSWLQDIREQRAEADKSWTRVRLKLADDSVKQFDLAGHFSKDNPENLELTLGFFDHSELYGQDDQGISFIALCVHELRTPLTLLRGYIEVFQRELQPEQLTPELNGFIRKMNVAAQQLTAFVGNMLDIARVESDQLTLKLQQADWKEVMTSTTDNLKLLAEVRGIELTCQIAVGLPAVGVDRVSIAEVMNNLVDNAIKYSGDSKKVVISSQLNKEGLVETTVQDWGVGIPASTLPNLFTRFYRNFRNRAQIGGTGLGLFLCKSIIGAHGGNIWVQSHEGQGTTIGFTVLPYDRLADEQKTGDTEGIIRGAHGWIKNHSLYRR